MGQVLHLKSNYCCCMWSSKSRRVLACLFSAPLHIWVKYMMLCCRMWQLSAKRRDGQLAWIMLHELSAASVFFYEYLHGHEHLSVCFTFLPVKVGFVTSLLHTRGICEAYFVVICKAFWTYKALCKYQVAHLHISSNVGALWADKV